MNLVSLLFKAESPSLRSLCRRVADWYVLVSTSFDHRQSRAAAMESSCCPSHDLPAFTCDGKGSLFSASGSLARPFDLSDVLLAQLQHSTLEFAHTWSTNASLSLVLVFSLAFHFFLKDYTVLMSRPPSALFFFGRLSLNAFTLSQRHILLSEDRIFGS